MNIFDILRKPRATAAELRDAIGKLSVADAERRVTELEANQREILLHGTEADADAVETEITRANRDVTRTVAAIEDLTLRIAEAEARELPGLIEQRATENRKCWESLRHSYLEIDRLASQLAAAMARNEALMNEFRAGNVYVVNAGRSDLKLPPPLLCLAERLGRATVDDPIQRLQLPGYFMNAAVAAQAWNFPAPPSTLSQLKDVGL